MSEEIADIIDAGADAIEKHGWTRRTLRRKRASSYGPAGALCMIGGVLTEINPDILANSKIVFATTLTKKQMEQYQKARDALRAGIHRSGSRAANPEGWNDYRFRTEQQVLDMMRATAKWERMHD